MFADEKQYKAVKYAVDSLKIEGMEPSFEKVNEIKNLLVGKISPNNIRGKFENH